MKIATIKGGLQIGFDFQKVIPAFKRKRFRLSVPNMSPFIPNIGDWFISDSAEKILDYDEVISIDPKIADQSDWDYINRNCNALVLKGGNYLSGTVLSSLLDIDTAKKIKIPVIFWGAGAQSINGEFNINDEGREVLRYISEYSTVAIRGLETENFLRQIGVNNTQIIGCPTIFYSLNPKISIRPVKKENVLFSYRSHLHSDNNFTQVLLHAIQIVHKQAKKMTVVLQGGDPVMNQYFNVIRWGSKMVDNVDGVEGTNLIRNRRSEVDQSAVISRYNSRWTSNKLNQSSSDLIEDFSKNLFFSYDPDDYFDLFKAAGFVIGLRMHSNLLALAHGAPTFFLTYDSRTREISDLFDIPRTSLFKFTEETRFFESDWTKFEKRYVEQYRSLRLYLERMGLKNNMKF